MRSVDSREIQINSTPLGFVKATRDVGFYMLFFPQLIAGPIVRARQFWPQIESKKFRDIQWGTAFKFLTLGYFLKMVVADNLAEYTPYLKSLELVGSIDVYKRQVPGREQEDCRKESDQEEARKRILTPALRHFCSISLASSS